MRMDDLVLVSVDDHVVEPPDMFEKHLAAKWRDIAPRVIARDDGTDVWLYEGKEIPNIGLNAVAGRPPEEYGMEPTAFAELRPGCYDVHQRVRDMDANGVTGSMCFPSFPQLCGQLFARSSDYDAARHPPTVGPRRNGRRGAPREREGRACHLILREPVEAETAVVPQ
jgi:hypothetical protein